MKNTKAQSAMEYLMTYGWAILIIVVVLAVLFSLGLFNGSKIVGTTCRTSSEYICQGVSYAGGTLSLTIGQSSGIDWQSYMVSYVPSSFTSTASTGIPSVLTTGNWITPNVDGNYLASGVTEALTLSVGPSGTDTAAPSLAAGQTTSGTLWACYSTTSTTAADAANCESGTSVSYASLATLSAVGS